MKKEWSWRDSGNHGPLIKTFNFASRISGYARKPFVPEQLMEQAVKRSGLSDFGPDDFREGFDLLCKSYSDEPNLTGLGQKAGRAVIVDSLVNRLELIDWHKQHPEASNEVIQSPWVMTGLGRSGTTLSANLIDLDPRVRSPLRWEIDKPMPPVKLAAQSSDPRIAECQKTLDLLDKMVPSMKVIHPQEATRPEECLLMMLMDFKCFILGSITSMADEYMDWWLEADKTSTYRVHKLLLQAWQSTVPTHTWSLKAPNHMHGISELLSVYPDARVLWSHRDPLVSIPSMASLQLTFMRLHLPNVDHKKAAATYNKQWLAGVKNMIAYDKAQEGKSWCHHVYYKDLIKDPVASIRGSYSHFGEELEPIHEKRIKAWVDQRPQHSFGKHVYSLEEFGLDPDEMREQYAEYMERYDVPVEYKG